MTKDEAVKQIRDHLFEIRRIAIELGACDYLTLDIQCRNGCDAISFNNEYWEDGAHGDDGLGIGYFETFGDDGE